MKNIKLANYILEKPSGKGSMGTVYLARLRNQNIDEENPKEFKVAIKILN